MRVEPQMLLIYNDLGIQDQLNTQVSVTIIYYVWREKSLFFQKYRNFFEKNPVMWLIKNLKLLRKQSGVVVDTLNQEAEASGSQWVWG